MRRFLDKYVGCDTALKKRRIVTPSVCHCIFASETTCSGIGNTEHVCARSPCVLVCCVQARGLRRADELAVPDNGVRQRQLLPRRRRRHSRLMRSDGDRPERLVSNAAGRHERELLSCDSNSVKKKKLTSDGAERRPVAGRFGPDFQVKNNGTQFSGFSGTSNGQQILV